jgi:hypothetical protein
MKYEEIKDKTVALLMMGADANGEDEWAVVVGTVTQSGQTLTFVHDGQPEGFPLPVDALERMQPTTKETREILGADIVLSLSIGPMPEGHEGEALSTGLKWPEKND